MDLSPLESESISKSKLLIRQDKLLIPFRIAANKLSNALGIIRALLKETNLSKIISLLNFLVLKLVTGNGPSFLCTFLHQANTILPLQ
jgi:hypothetical protein